MVRFMPPMSGMRKKPKKPKQSKMMRFNDMFEIWMLLPIFGRVIFCLNLARFKSATGNLGNYLKCVFSLIYYLVFRPSISILKALTKIWKQDRKNWWTCSHCTPKGRTFRRLDTFCPKTITYGLTLESAGLAFALILAEA